MATFEECCEEVNNNLTTMSNLLVAVAGAQLAFESRVFNLEQKVNVLASVLLPVTAFAQDSTALELWLSDELFGKPLIWDSALTAVDQALSKNNVETRYAFVGRFGDALGRWFLQVMISYFRSFPANGILDYLTPAEYIKYQLPISFYLLGSKWEALLQGVQNAYNSLNGGSNPDGTATGGLLEGQELSGQQAAIITSQFFLQVLIVGLSRVFDDVLKVSGEKKEEEDPIWAVMRRNIFGTADQPPLTEEELADIVAGSTTITEKPPPEEPPPPPPPGEEPLPPPPPQPGEPPPPTPPAEEGQPPQGGV